MTLSHEGYRDDSKHCAQCHARLEASGGFLHYRLDSDSVRPCFYNRTSRARTDLIRTGALSQ